MDPVLPFKQKTDKILQGNQVFSILLHFVKCVETKMQYSNMILSLKPAVCNSLPQSTSICSIDHHPITAAAVHKIKSLDRIIFVL